MSYADQNPKDIYQYHQILNAVNVFISEKSGHNVVTFDRRERTWGLSRIVCKPAKQGGQ